MNEKLIEAIEVEIAAAEVLIGELEDAAADQSSVARQIIWKQATAHLATAKALAEQAKVRVKSQAFVRRMVISHIDRLTDELREVAL